MIKKPAGDIKDLVTREHIKFLQENLIGNPLSLDAAPTAAAPLLENNESGVYNNVYYKRVEGTIYVFNPSSTITITGTAK